MANLECQESGDNRAKVNPFAWFPHILEVWLTPDAMCFPVRGPGGEESPLPAEEAPGRNVPSLKAFREQPQRPYFSVAAQTALPHGTVSLGSCPDTIGNRLMRSAVAWAVIDSVRSSRWLVPLGIRCVIPVSSLLPHF